MSEPKRYTVTSALPYANGPLHIGHLAGAYLPADIYVRYLRLKGKDVAYICGSDEHGAAITLRAKKEGISPKEIVDKYHHLIKKSFEDFGISFDIYHRTSSELHHRTASDFFKVLNEKGAFTIEKSEQYYDEEAKQFLADRYITGTCPKCGYNNAYGDQCEKCGSTLNPTDLIEPKSTLSGNAPVLKETSHWYLPMQQHSEWLKIWFEKGLLNGEIQHHPKEWKANVLGQCMSWIDGGLHPRAMTRDLDWGVKVPVEGAEGKVLYVWLDAPIGYISATRQWAADNNKNWELYWKDKETKLVHFIGKDNIVFHCIIFPILLKSHSEFILPDNVPANEFLNLEGDKISTSRNHAVWLHEYLEDFPGRQDELRYVLCSIAPESKDSEFTWKDYQARVNNELVAIFGNFVNRALVLANKYFQGDCTTSRFDAINTRVTEVQLDGKNIYEIKTEIEQKIEAFKFREALSLMMDIARIGNIYLQGKEPWKHTDNMEYVQQVISECIQLSAYLSVVIEPFLPSSSIKLKGLLNMDNLTSGYQHLNSIDILKPGHQINAPELLFRKIEDADIDKQLQKLANSKKSNLNAPPMKETISFDDFTKMDIRTATILTAEKVEKADKLLKLTVDTGIDKRTVVSGIAEHFSPDEVVGKQVSILVNLAPRKIRGVESQGMILMAENSEGKLSFIAPEQKIEEGSIVR